MTNELKYPISPTSLTSKNYPKVRKDVERIIHERVKDINNTHEFIQELDFYISELTCETKEMFRQYPNAFEAERLLIEKLQKTNAIYSLVALELYLELTKGE